MRKAIFVAVILSLCVEGFTQTPVVGKAATDISLANVKGKSISLSSLKGKVVLIDFWASWCGPCKKTIPRLKVTYDKYKTKGLEIYGISLDNDVSNWKGAIKAYGIPWLQVIDATGAVAGKWNVNYIPNTFLLDKTGKIVAVNPSEEELNKLLQELLG